MTKQWGPITWFFLHTFSEKIHEKAFEKNRTIYLNLLYNLCINLPCPMCSNHAKYYLNSNKFKNIKTKDQKKRLNKDIPSIIHDKIYFRIFRIFNILTSWC